MTLEIIYEKLLLIAKIIAELAISIGLFGGTIAPITEPTPIDERFDWQNAKTEIISKRTHITKVFPHPTETGKFIMIQSAGLLHYYDEKFEDLPELNFPEGKEIKNATDTYIMDLPEWGREELSKDERTLRIYDKRDQPIYIFEDPFVLEKGITPTATSTKDEAQFVVENKKLYFKLPHSGKSIM